MAAIKAYRIPYHHLNKLNPSFSPLPLPMALPIKPRQPPLLRRNRPKTTRTTPRSNSEAREESPISEAKNEQQRPPFDINLAVLLAGFAFEAYSTPPEKAGQRETDTAGCQTVFLSQQFLREVYDGQLFIKLRKGVDFPAMDPWGTSDPYVIIQLDGQTAKSNVKWAMKEPIWNEDFTLNIKPSPTKSLQVRLVELSKRPSLSKLQDDISVMAWDANLVTPPKRMGNAEIKLESLCDGNLHEVEVELDGIGGGGKIYLEVKYLSYDKIEEEKQWWGMSFVSDFLMNSPLGSALKMAVGSETVNSSQFVDAAFGHLKSLNSLVEGKFDEYEQPDKFFWKSFGDTLNQSVLQKFGFSLPEANLLEGADLLNKIGIQSQRIAEEDYVESGLATPESKNEDDSKTNMPHTETGTSPTISDIKKASRDVLNQTENILGALIALSSAFSQQKSESSSTIGDEDGKDDSMTKAGAGYSTNGTRNIPGAGLKLGTENAEETRKLFSSAESAMEAWAMLATSLGQTSFITSDFEKICFLDNSSTDTQVAIWRDSLRKRLVVAFRGTEQARWKDLLTDLMMVPAGFNPERLGGDFKQEVQVHSGFLSAYDSVRNRIMALIKLSIGFCVEDALDDLPQWNVYVTGHSLGGALATLLALELSSSRMAKCRAISVTMYNFGSPRVGNKRFAEVYNEKVNDSWRIVNHRDIIPTVPRLMGYCHVAQPVYLAAGDLRDALANMEILGDGYQVDVIGESTPDVLVGEFMKGEKQLVEKILQTEINLLRSIRDGTALTQHMEDFYYIALLESVRLNYRRVDTAKPTGGRSATI